MNSWQIKTAFLCTCLVVAPSVVSCSGGGSPDPQTVEAKSLVPARAAVTGEKQRAQDDVTISGALLVEHQVDVAALREGIMSSISADLNTPVRKGQLLATLDDRQVAAERDAAAARVQELESDLKNWDAEVKVLEADQGRAELMWRDHLISQEQLDHIRYNLVADRFQSESARHKLDNARATLESLQLELEKTRVRAPFDGVIARRYIREGQHVANGERLFWVTSVAPLLVRFTVPDRLGATIKRGQDVQVSSVEQNAPIHVARITLVSPVVDPSSSTIEVVALLRGASGDLRPGMTVNIALRDHK